MLRRALEAMSKSAMTLFPILYFFNLALPSALSAQAAGNSSGALVITLADIPEDCKTRGTFEPLASLLQSTAASPSAEAYESLGTFYGREGRFSCAVAAFQAALARTPEARQIRYELALSLLENHAPDRAADELRVVLRDEPNSFKAHNAFGRAMQDLGQLERAADEFKTALAINPRFALASYDLARLLSTQKKYKAAIYYLKDGLSHSPAPNLALEMKIVLADAFAETGDYADSIPLFRDAVAAQPNSAELHFNLATAYAHNQDYPHAAEEYKETLRLDPNHIEAELSLAKALMNLSAVPEALHYLEDYTRRNPNDWEGQEIFGEALKDSARFPDAVQSLERAIQLNAASYEAHCHLGAVLGRLGRIDDAVRELRTAVELKPDGPEARYQLGLILHNEKNQAAAKEQFEIFEHLKQQTEQETQAAALNSHGNELLKQGLAREAVEAYQKALLLKPKDARLHYNLAFALAKLRDSGREEHQLREAIELDPHFAQAHDQLGSSLMQRQRFKEAEREFRAAIASDPQSAEALNNLGTLLGRQGKNDEAAALFREAISVDPQYTQAVVNLGLTLAAQANYLEAERQLRSALGLEPNNANALTALGMLQGKTGRDADSVQTFGKLVGLNPASSDAHVNLGIALGDVYDLQGALGEFSEAIRLAPDFSLAHYNKGRVLYALGRKDEARNELGEAVRLSPNYVSALFLLGVVEHSSPYATELFQRVVSLQPDNAEARLYLGRNLLQVGKKEEAVEQWKKAVDADPDNLAAYANLVRVLSQTGSPDAAEYMAKLSTLQERHQATDRVRQLNNFALQAAKDDNWPQALEQLQEAIALCQQCPQLAVLRKNIGIIYARSGDKENARQQLELALKLLPEGPEALSAREALRRLANAGVLRRTE